MKITKELLDKLIADQLNEDVNYTWKHKALAPTPNTPGNKPVGDVGRRQFNRVAKVVNPNENPLRLTAEDVNALINDPKLITPDIEKALNLMLVSTNNELKELATKALKAKEDLLYDKVKDREQSVTKPSITSVSGEVGKYADDMVAVVGRFFKTSNLKSRIKEISKFSELMLEPSRATRGRSVSQLMNDIMLLDIFNTIVKEFDYGSGAYLFEYFLALVMGGSVSGKESGEEGGMGAVDFRWDKGAGSAKFYASKDNISQSVRGFAKNEAVSYVIGLKKGEGIRGPSGTSEPVRIVQVDVHVINVKKQKDGRFLVRPSNDRQPIYDVEPAGSEEKPKLLLTPYIGSGSFVGTISLSATETESYKDMVQKKIDRIGGNYKKAFKAMSDMFRAMMVAKEDASSYISTGKLDKGNNAISNMQASENIFAELVSILDYDQEVDKNTGKIEKLSEELLDKLIKAVILES